MSALKQLPLSTSESDQYSTEQTSWKGWKPLSNEPSPPMNKENADEFPPLTNTLDSWSVLGIKILLEIHNFLDR